MPAMWYGGTLTSAASLLGPAMNSTVEITYDDEVPVAQQRGLRLAGGAAGEEPDGDLVGIGERVGFRYGVRDLRHELTRDHHDEVDARGPLRRIRQPSPRRGEATDDVPQPVVGQPVVDRRERDTGDAAREEQRGHHVGVDVDEADPLGVPAMSDAARRERPSKAA